MTEARGERSGLDKTPGRRVRAVNHPERYPRYFAEHFAELEARFGRERVDEAAGKLGDGFLFAQRAGHEPGGRKP